MKVKFEFDLPEDKSDYEMHHNAYNNYHIILEVLQTIRRKLKISESDIEIETLEEIRNLIYEEGFVENV